MQLKINVPQRHTAQTVVFIAKTGDVKAPRDGGTVQHCLVFNYPVVKLSFMLRKMDPACLEMGNFRVSTELVLPSLARSAVFTIDLIVYDS